MFRPRVIPVLLLQDKALVKSIKFKDYKYIGDPLNAVKVFNDLKADELVFLDIEATKQNKTISLDLVQRVGEEANMPFSVGGGIRTLKDIQNIISKGAEKIVINSKAVDDPDFIKLASNDFGSSTVVVCIDVKKKFLGKEVVWTKAGSRSSRYTPKDFAKLAEEKGAGEIIIQSIAKDGTMDGYDIDLIRDIAMSVSIPVVALGGASSLSNLDDAYRKAHASALGAGSMFVFQGKKRGVLINYPDSKDLKLFK